SRSHFVNQAAFVNSDDEHPLHEQADISMRNFIGGGDPITPENFCTETHKLEVTFNQTGTNSFALVYSYDNFDCDDNPVTGPTSSTQSTTTKHELITTTSSKSNEIT
ncbi:hypothetical protein PMAYCL1PPCAC_23165, partial [Pristionchus mayeri]